MKPRLYRDRSEGWIWYCWSVQHLTDHEFYRMVDLCNELDHLNPTTPET